MEELLMRAEVCRAVRRLKIAGVTLAALLVACADSPTDQLSRAENLLGQLKQNGAEAYLKYELAGARQKLEEARKFIRKNRFELAGQYLNSVCRTLDSCSVAFLQLRRVTEQQCRQQMEGLFTSIEAVRLQMNGLPRQSYIDQNRYDIYTHRLRLYRDEMDLLQKLMDEQNFTTALQRSLRLEHQVKQSLAGLVGVSPIPQRPTTTSTEHTTTGVVAEAAPHSSGH
jgi:hypothetical protein